MLHLKEFVFLVFILLFFCFNISFTFGQNIASTDFCLVLDPGHGGKDHGCAGHHSREKEIVLAIAKNVQEKLMHRSTGMRVLLTRDQDQFVSLDKRSNVANEAQADLFISLHCNAIHVPSVRGAETYVMGLHTSDENLEVAKRENNSILYEDDFINTYGGYDPNSTEGHIILSLFQNVYLDQSIQFAEKLQQRLADVAARKNRGVKQAGFVVLRKTTMPSVLVELGFLTHSQEEQYLLSEAGQDQLAEGLIQAILWYRNEYHADDQVPIAYEIRDQRDLKAIPKEALQSQPVSVVSLPKSVEKRPVESRLHYTVQIAATKQEAHFDLDAFGEEAPPIRTIEEDGLFKYQLGPFDTKATADIIKKQSRNLGFNASFIVAYDGSDKINIEIAERMEAEKRRMSNLAVGMKP